MTTHYVATYGNDSNSGSKNSPFASIDRAIDAVGAGDTIYLRGGTYSHSDNIRIDGVNGTPSQRIVLAGYPGERPVFQFDGPTPGGWSSGSDGGIQMSVSYWTLQNMVVRDSPYVGIQAVGSAAHHNVFQDIEVTNCNLTGLLLNDGAHDNTIVNVSAHGNYDPQSGGEDADGISCSNAPNNAIRDSVAYNNADDGYDLWESTDCTMSRCLAFDNGRDNGNGNGFKLGGGSSTSGGHLVQQCIAYENRRNGFNHNSASKRILVHNCTSFGNGRLGFQSWDGGTDTPHVFRNCISYRNSHGAVELHSEDDDSHNTWNLGISNPGFKSTDSASDDFLRLAADSPALDAGTDVGLSYGGDAPDLGAYEVDGTDGGDAPASPSSPTLYYHNGTDWQEVLLRRHDGEQFV